MTMVPLSQTIFCDNGTIVTKMIATYVVTMVPLSLKFLPPSLSKLKEARDTLQRPFKQSCPTELTCNHVSDNGTIVPKQLGILLVTMGPLSQNILQVIL